jgi:hypothetical protein
LTNVLVLKRANGNIPTGCTIYRIERKAEMSATGLGRAETPGFRPVPGYVNIDSSKP